MSSAVLSVTDLEMRYGVQTILNKATLAINEGDRIGLVGRNGTGKSTFLRIAAGVITPDAGQTVRRRELITGYLPQDFQLDDHIRPSKRTSSPARRLSWTSSPSTKTSRRTPIAPANCSTTSTTSTAGRSNTASARSSTT